MPAERCNVLNESLIIARKEMIDRLRDRRSVISSVMYTLMGPFVVGLVSLSPAIKGAGRRPIVGLMSVFTLVAAFSGGMNVAMDTVAGEREAVLATFIVEPRSTMGRDPREVAGGQFICGRGFDAQFARIFSGLCNIWNASERALAASLARDGARHLDPTSIGRLDRVVAFRRLPLREGSADLSLDACVSSHGCRDVPRVRTRRAASLA